MKETHVHPNIQKGRDRIFYYQSGFHFVLVKMEWVWVQDIWAVEIWAGPGHSLLSIHRRSCRHGSVKIHLLPLPLELQSMATQSGWQNAWPHRLKGHLTKGRMKWWSDGKEGVCVCVYVCAMKLSRWTIDRQRIIKKINQHDIVFQR